jgi:D-sedoheptulose 7-phosphate isomerase
MNHILEHMLKKYPELETCREEIVEAWTLLREGYRKGGKLLVCGNGGSAADSEHIVGELMKGFRLRREVPEAFRKKLELDFQQEGEYLASRLQGALPAISLASHVGLMTAISNDVGPDMVFAQQVYGIGRAGDLLLGISTSGSSKNVLNAFQVARSMGVRTIGLAGNRADQLRKVCDVVMGVPYSDTYEVQESHVAVYHALCGMLEEEFFFDDDSGRR